MDFTTEFAHTSALRTAIANAYLADEASAVEKLIPEAQFSPQSRQRIKDHTRRLVEAIREKGKRNRGIEAFMAEYNLTSKEGVVLMCLAESLLRVPDRTTADTLIHDKISVGNWRKHLGQSSSLFVNASTWGLVLTGKMIQFDDARDEPATVFDRIVSRSGEPFIRVALKKAMRNLGEQYVLGQTIEEALYRSRRMNQDRHVFSFDMLGEAAICKADADRYFHAYIHAIEALEEFTKNEDDIFRAPSISIKLSALHPRFDYTQRKRVLPELVEKLLHLVVKARSLGVAVTLDAEEADRLEFMIDVFTEVYRSKPLKDWEGLGLAVQTYQKRASHVIDYLTDLSWTHKQRIPVRLVKGAYWDTEIKRYQERGLNGYPVFTRKTATDVSYLACARRLFAAREAFFPQFATHNAYTVASIIELAGDYDGYELQKLYGMGDDLYDELFANFEVAVPCRVYAPVGAHEDLLPYLVRRLLENGANTSFVHRIINDEIDIEQLLTDPAEKLRATHPKSHPKITLPLDIYKPQRINSRGVNLDDRETLENLTMQLNHALSMSWTASALVDGQTLNGQEKEIRNPADSRVTTGYVSLTHFDAVEHAISSAYKARHYWNQTGAERRAEILEHAAELLEQNRYELIALCIKEGGKTLRDSIAEVREAVDFCNYYAHQARRNFAAPKIMPGPTGELNKLSLHGRGVFACISPWNFPLAIFTGQVTAALAAGNCVLAKPASQTPISAFRVVRLLHKAGVPHDVLHLLPGDGKTIGNKIISDSRIGGVAFTGSTETARSMQLLLAGRRGSIIPFVAETGGQNAMIVDSSALAEQVVTDAVHSAFNSAGQRCSALRVLFIQEEMAPRVMELLAGASAELCMADPAGLACDIGPVIDERAKLGLEQHCKFLQEHGRLIYQSPLPPQTDNGNYFPPTIFEIEHLRLLSREVFGPILHVIRYRSGQLDAVIDAINNTGYGLTLGIHSRIDTVINYIQERVRVGNIYVNRNMIGAVVGSQPFGGEGLSGTGPKAGGPFYLQRFATERCISTNTSAIGGNATLLSLVGDND